ncbi:MAG: toll/interleukin-1 receptor domain-containing protein [Janthinobacterium lividum]
MPTTRTSVFISYSHADLQWLRMLNIHLETLTREQKVEIWSDQKIRKGARWREQIHKQLAMARVGIVLVSADFLASDFIHAEELPPLLEAADKEGATLLTIIVRPCAGAFQDSPLSQLQAMNGPHMPLSKMNKNQREELMDSVYGELRNIFRTPAAKPKPVSTKAKLTDKTLKRVQSVADASPAEEAAAKAKEIAQQKAIAKRRVAAAAKKLADAKKTDAEKKPATKKAPARPASTRAKKK